jgi:hypothetical protein
MGNGIARVPFVGGIWDGQRRCTDHDSAGRLRDVVRDDLGRPVYRLEYDAVASGELGTTYRNPRYRFADA